MSRASSGKERPGARPSLLTLALAALALPALAALGPRYGGSLRVGVLDLKGGDAPSFTRGLGARLLQGLRHETLVRLGPGGERRGALAARWSASASGREWHLEIASSARFQRGAPVTPDDVVRSLRRFLRSTSPAGGALASLLDGGVDFREGRTEELPGLLGEAPRSVVLRLLSRSASLPAPLAAEAASITSPEGDASGPFTLVHAVRDERAVLLPSASHVFGRPFLDEVEILRFPEREALDVALASGAVEVGLGAQGPQEPSARLVLALDASRPLLAEKRERARLAQGVDRVSLARHFLQGGVPLCGLIDEESEEAGCGPFTPPAPRAPGAAVPLLLAVDRAVPRSASGRVVAHLLALGYEPKVVLEDADSILEHPADARLLLFVPEVDTKEARLVELALLPGTPPGVRALVTAPNLTEDPAARKAAEEALLEASTVVPLAATSFYAVGNPRVQGVSLLATGCLGLEDTWLSL